MSFLANRTRYLDQINGSLLFRGSLPQTNSQFVVDAVLDSMMQQAKEKKVPFNRKACFLDFSLLAQAIEHREIIVEDHFFEQHNSLGKFYNEDIDLLAILTISLGLGALGEAMLEVVRKIRQHMQTNSGCNVYIHCSAGLDRTGIISAGYGLLYRGFTAEEARNENLAQKLPRAPNGVSMIAINAMIEVLGRK